MCLCLSEIGGTEWDQSNRSDPNVLNPTRFPSRSGKDNGLGTKPKPLFLMVGPE